MILLDPEYCLLLISLVLQIHDNGCDANGYSIIVSKEVTAQVGLCVHIPCKFTVPTTVTINTDATGLWYRPRYKEEFVAWNKAQTRGRVFFTGDVWRGDCSLFINDVQKSDQNTYQFRLEDKPPIKYTYTNIMPKLRVTELTDKPEISMGKLVAGETAKITCRSPGTCAGTAPVITWEGKYGRWQSFRQPYPNTTSEYSSIITFTPSKEDNNLRLLCRVSFLQGTARTEQSISLNVEYAPHVSITAAGATDQSFIVKEGDTKMISCNVDSNPAAEITWSVGDKVIQGPTTAPQLIYRLNRINLSDAGNYSCFGKNDHGTSHGTINIIVHYQPRTPTITCSTTEDCAIDSQRMVNVMENSTLSLLCKAESLPEASLSWETPGKQTIVNGQLTLHDISLSDEGKFTCVASNIHGKSESSITIKVTYEPRKVTGRNSTCWTHGSHIECHCIIQSYPTAKVEWNVNEKLYPSNHSDERVNIFTVTLNAVTNSTLTSIQTNIGSIQCRSSNKHGRLDLLLFSRTYSHSTTKIIAVTSCVIVIVLLLIGSLFVVHLFKKKKLTNKKEDNKEIRENDCNVIYSNTGPHLYGNNTEEVESSSVQDDSNASVYMNVEDMQYAVINFSKIKPHKIPENIEIEYAEIKK